MNSFGGKWTIDKINILIEYTKAYLTIMNKYPYWKLLYFDGFAGSGIIISEPDFDGLDYKLGAASRILRIDSPRSFDNYYFVEKSNDFANQLRLLVENNFSDKNCTIKIEDCNKKIIDLAIFLKSEKGKNFRVLAFIDPYGMQLEFNSIKELSSTKVDLWILVPTGLGVNRLLTKDGEITTGCLNRLKLFLGLTEEKIKEYFYKELTDFTLFGDQNILKKEDNAINKIASLYQLRLNEIFDHVSNPFVLKNSKGSIMYHFFMASNNKTAEKIANDIIKKYNKD